MTYSISVTEDDVFTALRAFIMNAFGCEVVRGLDNRVPMPIGGFINMTPGTQQRLATNTVIGIPATLPINETQSVTQPVMQSVQLDFYGPSSGNWASIFATLWRDTTTCDFLTVVQPLYNSDPMQMAVVTGESQYVERWIVRAFMQYNTKVTLVQQFFKGATVELINVESTYN